MHILKKDELKQEVYDITLKHEKKSTDYFQDLSQELIGMCETILDLRRVICYLLLLDKKREAHYLCRRLDSAVDEMYIKDLKIKL